MKRDYEAELQELLDNKWDDDYFRLLAIYDHLVECKLKYEAYKLEAINSNFTKEELKHELFKELTDLNILLDMNRLKDDNKLYVQRIMRFKEKMNISNS